MNIQDQENINFYRITKAIEYISQNFKTQPGLDTIAKNIHLSPFHFQRMFTEWAGTSPKNFLQYISIGYAKKMLEENMPLSDAAFETGLSGSSRLHDLFIKIEGMTPGEYKNGGKNLTIHYDFANSPFGKIIIASTGKGICYISFADNELKSFDLLQMKFPKAQFRQETDSIQQKALFIFKSDWGNPQQIKLHIKGTDFQIKVWEMLLKIPLGKLTTYGNIAREMENSKAYRAVGTAVGDNPVAFLIPCHRVIQSTGALGDYHWGNTRKRAIIGWEASRINV